ncbi:MAG: porin [Akkermansiaceae bacterium]|jgi:hypothetical protein|tara:strand:- start:3337 stop:4503 length:1167 start_codon:yes stop_codon:yes gene_type:complete
MNQTLKLTTAASIAAISTALAGPTPAEVAPHAPSTTGDWCNSLQTFGKFHSDKNASFIQELKFFGRFQWQAGSVDGDDFSGMSTHDNFTEIRRLRIGTQVKFFNHFKLKVNANLEDGGPNDHSYGYHSLDEAKLTYSAGDILGLEDVAFTYGRHKFTFSQEAHTSSKKIKTIERSNIANYFYGSARPTGLTATGTKGRVTGTFGIFSTDTDTEIAGWDEGLAYYANLQMEAAGGNVNFDFLYNDISTGDIDEFGFEWAASTAYTRTFGSWEVMANILYGERHDGDAVYGFVLMPSTFLIEDRLEFVARYQFAGSDGDNLKLTSRYAKRAGGDIGDKGDTNHTLYAGLNYYLCGNNSKFQFGVEHETMDQEDGDSADATTLWAAYRMYF